MMFPRGPLHIYDELRYTERITPPPPSIIKDKICECVQRVDETLEHFDLTKKISWCYVIPIIGIVNCLR